MYDLSASDCSAGLASEILAPLAATISDLVRGLGPVEELLPVSLAGRAPGDGGAILLSSSLLRISADSTCTNGPSTCMTIAISCAGVRNFSRCKRSQYCHSEGLFVEQPPGLPARTLLGDGGMTPLPPGSRALNSAGGGGMTPLPPGSIGQWEFPPPPVPTRASLELAGLKDQWLHCVLDSIVIEYCSAHTLQKCRPQHIKAPPVWAHLA
jgi:hypothetical protein